jgi:hypothetical protein
VAWARRQRDLARQLPQSRRPRSGRDQVLARRRRVRRSARRGSGVGRHGSSGRDRKWTIPTRQQVSSIRLPCEKGAGKEGKTQGGPRLSQANDVEAERQGGETNAGKIQAHGGQEEGSRKDEARTCEKSASEVQNSADEIDESRSNAESHPEDSFEDAAARQVKAWAMAQVRSASDQRPGYQYAACGLVRSTTTNWLANTR